MSAPLSPPTLHRRSVESNSITMLVQTLRRGYKQSKEKQKKKKKGKKRVALTSDGRVIVGVFPDMLVHAILLTVHSQELEDIWTGRIS